jgi:arginyl-tRNA synthetase
MVDVWGADHGGYVKRVQAGVRALSRDQGRLDVRICQLVNLMDEGKALKMSKRAGRIVTLRDVVDEVGRDVVRFVMLPARTTPRSTSTSPRSPSSRRTTRSSTSSTRTPGSAPCSAARRGGSAEALPRAGLRGDGCRGAPGDPAELAVLRQLASWPRTVEGPRRPLSRTA